jgi:hypothetical protein
MHSLAEMRDHRMLAAMFLLGGVAIVLLRVFDPAASGVFPPCPVRYLTGLYCPGCGSLRAMHALLHGDIGRAWAMNPLMMVTLPFLTYGLVSEALLELRGSRLPEVMLPASWIRAFCFVVVLYAVARNLPLYPFDLLAPGAMLHL